MKKNLLILTVIFIAVLASCRRDYYKNSFFDQQTARHKIIAVLPSEMVYTGKMPENMTPEQITKIEEEESKSFQLSLYSNILRYANSRRYYMFVGVQDISSTLHALENNGISIKDSWKMNDQKLTELLGVDAVVRMQITKRRYMSDYASYGVAVARNVIRETPLGNKLPVPRSLGKTEDVYAYCTVVSNGMTLWNNYYKGYADWNNPSNVIIENITQSFGENFPYKRRRK